MPRTRRPKKVQMTGQFHPDIAAQIRFASEKLDWSIAEVIAECVERDLPRLLEREKKRTQRRTLR